MNHRIWREDSSDGTTANFYEFGGFVEDFLFSRWVFLEAKRYRKKKEVLKRDFQHALRTGGERKNKEICGYIPVLEKIFKFKKGVVAWSQSIEGEIVQVCFQIFTISSFNFDFSSFSCCFWRFIFATWCGRQWPLGCYAESEFFFFTYFVLIL